jgi:hypothetical protein
MKRLIITLIIFAALATIARCAFEQHQRAVAWWETKPIERVR